MRLDGVSPSSREKASGGSTDRCGGSRGARPRGLSRLVAPVLETVSRVSRFAGVAVSLIGFCGRPRRSRPTWWPARDPGRPAAGPGDGGCDPQLFQRADRTLSIEASGTYLIVQPPRRCRRLGAHLRQLGGRARGRSVRALVDRADARIVALVRGAMPSARIIGLSEGVQFGLERYIDETGVDAVSIDWTVPLDIAHRRLEPSSRCRATDPAVLVAGVMVLDVRSIASLAKPCRRPIYLFNLGHGIVPETPISTSSRWSRRAAIDEFGRAGGERLSLGEGVACRRSHRVGWPGSSYLPGASSLTTPGLRSDRRIGDVQGDGAAAADGDHDAGDDRDLALRPPRSPPSAISWSEHRPMANIGRVIVMTLFQAWLAARVAIFPTTHTVFRPHWTASSTSRRRSSSSRSLSW